jgi:uncharacterized glyoxalase superfamily protein PhnB
MEGRMKYSSKQDKHLLRAAMPSPGSLAPASTRRSEIYATLSDGGAIFMPIQETFFAFRFAQLRDKCGTSWMILHERPRP